MQYIYLTFYIVIIILLLSSCESNNPFLEEQERVEVHFTATLPYKLQTSSYGKDMLYIGIFDSKGDELIRKFSPIESASSNIDFTISLAKDKSSDIVFWEQNEECDMYDLTDMKSIKMNTANIDADFATIEKMDAFYATCNNVTRYQSSIHTVELVHPLSQINVGTTGKHSGNSELKITAAPTSSNPLTKEVNDPKDLTFSYSAATDEKLSIEGVTYNYLAIG